MLPPATPFDHPDTTKFSDEQLDALIEIIQAKRMAAYRSFKETKDILIAAKLTGTHEKINKQLAAFEKHLASVDKAIEKLQLRANQVRALRLYAIELEVNNDKNA